MFFRLPQGLEDVSKVPSLVAELLRRNWTETEVKAALGENLLRVLRETEKVSTVKEMQQCKMLSIALICTILNQAI